MKSIFWKEINTFFSSSIGFVVIGVFISLLGLILWVFPDFSILENQFATLDSMFYVAPLVFTFLIPAITMRTLSEEKQNGTFELLLTKPLTDLEILMGKFWACFALTIIALLPTLIYFTSVYYLGSPKGNLDIGATFGSYIGLCFLAACFCSIGMFGSSLSQNQIIAFLISTFLCFFLYWGFYFLSKLPFFSGKGDDLVQEIGLDFHYQAVSRGFIDFGNILYFVFISALFIFLTWIQMSKRNF